MRLSRDSHYILTSLPFFSTTKKNDLRSLRLLSSSFFYHHESAEKFEVESALKEFSVRSLGAYTGHSRAQILARSAGHESIREKESAFSLSASDPESPEAALLVEEDEDDDDEVEEDGSRISKAGTRRVARKDAVPTATTSAHGSVDSAAPNDAVPFASNDVDSAEDNAVSAAPRSLDSAAVRDTVATLRDDPVSATPRNAASDAPISGTDLPFQTPSRESNPNSVDFPASGKENASESNPAFQGDAVQMDSEGFKKPPPPTKRNLP